MQNGYHDNKGRPGRSLNDTFDWQTPKTPGLVQTAYVSLTMPELGPIALRSCQGIKYQIVGENRVNITEIRVNVLQLKVNHEQHVHF